MGINTGFYAKCTILLRLFAFFMIWKDLFVYIIIIFSLNPPVSDGFVLAISSVLAYIRCYRCNKKALCDKVS